MHQGLVNVLDDAIVGNLDMHRMVHDLYQLPAVKSSESDCLQTQRFRNIDGADDIRRISAAGNRDQDVALLRHALKLVLEYPVERQVIPDRG
jgi:hypothetical protein